MPQHSCGSGLRGGLGADIGAEIGTEIRVEAGTGWFIEEKKNTRKRSQLFYARLATIDARPLVMPDATGAVSPKGQAFLPNVACGTCAADSAFGLSQDARNRR